MLIVPLVVIGLVAWFVSSGRVGRTVDRPELGPVRRPSPARAEPAARADARSEWAVARQIARFEGRRLLRHPAVLAGAVLSLPALFFSEGEAPALSIAAVQKGLAAFPMAGLVLVAANLATLRSRREGTAEVVDPAAAGERARTLGHLLSLWAPVAWWLALVGIWAASSLGGTHAGAFDRAALLELAGSAVLVAAGGACGVTLARWVPSTAVAPIAVVALGLAEAALATGPQPETNRMRWLAWFVPQPGDVVDVWPREPGWHLVYLLGLVGLVALVALMRSGIGRLELALTSVVLAVIVVAGVVQVQPLTDDERQQVAAWLAGGEGTQRCTTAGAVTTCAYPDHDFSAEWRPVAAGVLAAMPAAARPSGVAVLQRPSAELWRSIGRDLGLGDQPSPPPAGAGPVVVETDLGWPSGGPHRGRAHLVLGANLAAAMLDLPSGGPAAPLNDRCYVGGQARGVVALWLAASSSPAAAGALRALAGTPGEPPSGSEAMLPDAAPAPDDGAAVVEVPAAARLHSSLGTESWVMHAETAVAWSLTDLHHAVDLLDLPPAEAARRLNRSWTLVGDTATTSGELAEALGLPARPSAAELAARAGFEPVDENRVVAGLGGRCP